jgi:hypothetical protein
VGFTTHPGLVDKVLICQHRRQLRIGCCIAEGEYMELQETQVPGRRKYGWLPLLTVLFLVAYGIMTLLIVEQGNTINSQSLLIRQLFHDSVQLSHLRGEAARKKHLPAGPPKAEAKKRPAPKAEPEEEEPGAYSRQAPADLRRSTIHI